MISVYNHHTAEFYNIRPTREIPWNPDKRHWDIFLYPGNHPVNT
jgi:hypothetical protein